MLKVNSSGVKDSHSGLCGSHCPLGAQSRACWDKRGMLCRGGNQKQQDQCFHQRKVRQPQEEKGKRNCFPFKSLFIRSYKLQKFYVFIIMSIQHNSVLKAVNAPFCSVFFPPTGGDKTSIVWNTSAHSLLSAIIKVLKYRICAF